MSLSGDDLEKWRRLCPSCGAGVTGWTKSNSEDVRQTEVCRSFRQCANGGSRRQTSVCRTSSELAGGIPSYCAPKAPPIYAQASQSQGRGYERCSSTALLARLGAVRPKSLLETGGSP